MDLNKLNLWISLIASVCMILETVTGFFSSLWNKIKNFGLKVLNRAHTHQKQTIVLINTNKFIENFWHVGSAEGKPILQVNVQLLATNIVDVDITISTAKIKGYEDYLEKLIMLDNPQTRYVSEQHCIPVGQTRTLHMTFIICDFKGKDFQNKVPQRVTIEIFDQFGNNHIIKRVDLFATGVLPFIAK